MHIINFVGLKKSRYRVNVFLFFSVAGCVVGTHWSRLHEMFSVGVHGMCFHGDLREILILYI